MSLVVLMSLNKFGHRYLVSSLRVSLSDYLTFHLRILSRVIDVRSQLEALQVFDVNVLAIRSLSLVKTAGVTDANS